MRTIPSDRLNCLSPLGTRGLGEANLGLDRQQQGIRDAGNTDLVNSSVVFPLRLSGETPYKRGNPNHLGPESAAEPLWTKNPPR